MDLIEKLRKAVDDGETIEGYDAADLLAAYESAEMDIEMAFAALTSATKASLGRLWAALAAITNQDPLTTKLMVEGMLQYFDMKYLMCVVDYNKEDDGDDQ